ncbi:MAG: PrgI family protein [Candidatus Moraniibacteriota bacterium]
MRKREVPQFINIEDKIAFQLTAKQLGWAGLGGFFIFISWVFFEQTVFIVIAVVVGLIDVAILFVRPYGMSMPEFIKSIVFYLFKTKNYVWRRSGSYSLKKEEQKFNKKKQDKKAEEFDNKQRRGKSPEDIKKAAKALDIFDK